MVPTIAQPRQELLLVWRSIVVSLLVATAFSMLSGCVSQDPATQAKEMWSRVWKAEADSHSGTLEYGLKLGNQQDWPEMRVRAAWSDSRMVVEILSPSRCRSGFALSGNKLVDWSPSKSTVFTITGRAQNHFGREPSAHELLTSPYSLEAVLAHLHDPGGRSTDLMFQPNKVFDSGDSWVFTFPVPDGYPGPGYQCTVAKTSMLPTLLTRKGEFMPDLRITYSYKQLPPNAFDFRFIHGATRASAPSLENAIGRCQFFHQYDNFKPGISR